MRLCEVTLKKDRTPAGQKRPELLHRTVELPELKGTVRLLLSTEGLKVLSEAGGLTKFLQERSDKKLSARLKKIKTKLVAAGAITIKQEAPEQTEAPQPTEEATK